MCLSEIVKPRQWGDSGQWKENIPFNCCGVIQLYCQVSLAVTSYVLDASFIEFYSSSQLSSDEPMAPFTNSALPLSRHTFLCSALMSSWCDNGQLLLVHSSWCDNGQLLLVHSSWCDNGQLLLVHSSWCDNGQLLLVHSEFTTESMKLWEFKKICCSF